MLIAQVLHGKAHWIFEADKKPDFPPDPHGNPIILVDISDSPEVREGWIFDAETLSFREPTIEDRILEEQGRLSDIEILEQNLIQETIRRLEQEQAIMELTTALALLQGGTE